MGVWLARLINNCVPEWLTIESRMARYIEFILVTHGAHCMHEAIKQRLQLLAVSLQASYIADGEEKLLAT